MLNSINFKGYNNIATGFLLMATGNIPHSDSLLPEDAHEDKEYEYFSSRRRLDINFERDSDDFILLHCSSPPPSLNGFRETEKSKRLVIFEITYCAQPARRGHVPWGSVSVQ